MSDHTVTVECPRCSEEIEVEVSISGGFTPASRWEEASAPDVEWAAIEGCTHTPDETQEFTPGDFTREEKNALYAAIEEAAIEAHADSAFDPAWDGPEDDR